jgi:predicted alpha/beta superfamily hydrolase
VTRTLVFALWLFFLSCKGYKELPVGEAFTIHSSNTSDDYIIRLLKPGDFRATKKYLIVYSADGEIGLGHYLRGTDPGWKAEIPSNCIVVTIGHAGDWHKKRMRDFIPSDAGGYNDSLFGHADNFTLFLKTELIPFINNKIPNQQDRVLIGHSFSGLFCLYAALQNGNLFDQYFAISPSAWANHGELLKIEKQLAPDNNSANAHIHIYAGGLELFNKVLSSSREFYNTLRARNYPGLTISFEVIRYANHFSVRKPVIDKILASLSK